MGLRFFFTIYAMLLTVLIACIILALVFAMTRTAGSRRAVLPVLTSSPIVGITAMPDVFAGTGLSVKIADGFQGVPSSAPESITGMYNGIGSVIDGRYFALHTLATR